MLIYKNKIRIKMSDDTECKIGNVKIIQMDEKKKFIDEDKIYDEIINSNKILYLQCGSKKIFPQSDGKSLKFNTSEFENQYINVNDIYIGLEGDYSHKEKEDILIKIFSLCPLSIRS